MTMVLAISAVEQVFTIEEEDNIEAGLERSEHYMEKIEENYCLPFGKESKGASSINGNGQWSKLVPL